jgi:hypothetical protein
MPAAAAAIFVHGPRPMAKPEARHFLQPAIHPIFRSRCSLPGSRFSRLFICLFAALLTAEQLWGQKTRPMQLQNNAQYLIGNHIQKYEKYDG